jgi:hypothetical protein
LFDHCFYICPRSCGRWADVHGSLCHLGHLLTYLKDEGETQSRLVEDVKGVGTRLPTYHYNSKHRDSRHYTPLHAITRSALMEVPEYAGATIAPNSSGLEAPPCPIDGVATADSRDTFADENTRTMSKKCVVYSSIGSISWVHIA